MRAQQVQREEQQGLGRPIIAAEFQGHRFVAVGAQLLWSKSWRTFHDFLFDYLPRVMGKDWGTEELKKPLESQHPLFRLYSAVKKLRDDNSIAGKEVQTAIMTGAAAAYLGLAYNLYLLAHNAALHEHLLKRLRNAAQFWPAFYETSVAARFIQAGFTIDLEEETDPRTTHCEFVATHRSSGRSFSVEAKRREPNKKGFGVNNQLYEALKKASKHPRVVFIDVNVDARGGTQKDPYEALPWLKEALASIRSREEAMTISGAPAPPAYVVVTSEPYEAHMNSQYVGLAFAAEGFKIADLKVDSAMTLREARLAREAHREIFDLLASMQRHQGIPLTFDGENPELAFADPGAPRLIVGEKYLIPDGNGDEVVGVLESAIANPKAANAIGIYRLESGKRVIASSPLTPTEVAAYQRHPDTFFGTYSPASRKANDALDLYDFFFESYSNAPRERLLEFMKGHADSALLSELSQRELAIIYCERMAEAVAQKGQRAERG